MPTHIHGKNAVIYLGTGGGAASIILEQVDWSIDMDQTMVDASSLNTQWKTFVKGMFGWSGTFTANFNTGQSTLWTASLDDVPENFYLYPTVASTARYYYGTGWAQLTKIAAGSTTAKATSGWKLTGEGALSFN